MAATVWAGRSGDKVVAARAADPGRRPGARALALRRGAPVTAPSAPSSAPAAAPGAPVDLVCLDVDGTLVGSAGVVPEAVWPAVERLRAAGVRLCVCSGRPGFGQARALAERLDPDGWHVFQNGASVVHLGSGASRSTPLPGGAADELADRARATGRLLEVYTDLAYAVEAHSPAAGERAARHAALLGVPYEPRPVSALGGPAVRAQWLTTAPEAALIRAEPHAGLTVAASTSPVMPDTLFLNVTAEGVDKGAAVRAVAEAYGVPLARVMMVGDGANDVSALRAVGWAVAMGNAEHEALEAAAYRVGHVDGLGLVEALGLALRGG